MTRRLHAWFTLDADLNPLGLCIARIKDTHQIVPLATFDEGEATGPYGQLAVTYAHQHNIPVQLFAFDLADVAPVILPGIVTGESSRCPTCSRTTDLPSRPHPNAYFFCGHCGSWAVYTLDEARSFVLRLPTNEEMAMVRRDPYFQSYQDDITKDMMRRGGTQP